MAEKKLPETGVDWEAFRQGMGYTPEELEAFRSHANNAYVVENAHLLDRWVIVAEVIDSHGCAAGHKVGDKLYFSPHGVLETEKGPARICVQAIPALASAVAVFQERIIAGLSPDPYLFRQVGCVDVGVACGGWGHVAFRLYALPR
ncbi:MAG: hypothetical protein QHH80_06340 [Anaerolineae bacterium]|nr:hypothetical protein [Anaerolineae bacterium]